uniref:DUF3667 domain-containing protein n=1 Tax=uncultured Draconibacterium sp. TaxID=1573823 RepID=UPI003216CF0E
MLSKILPRLRRKKPDADSKPVVCVNCKTEFTGNFCPNCGQSVDDYDKPISFVIYNFLGDFFAFDTRFFKSFVAILFRPGFLSKEYIEGRRVPYAPPFRLYVFVSFVLFLLLQIYTNRGLVAVLDSDFSEGKFGLDSTSLVVADSVFAEARSEMDSAELAVTDSIISEIGDLKKAVGIDGSLTPVADIGSGGSTDLLAENPKNTRDLLDSAISMLETKLNNEQDPDKKAQLRKFIRICRSPEQAIAKILKYISWAFFLLLPILAVILKLVYIRRKHNYIRHLVFSIHIHAFIFIIQILVVGLLMIFSGEARAVILILLLWVPVYFIIALKKFYGQSIGKTIAKALVVSFAYNVIFLTVLILATFNALNML